MNSSSASSRFHSSRFDARPDRLDFRDRVYTPPLRSLEPRFPTDTDIETFMGSYAKHGLVLDQGEEGACTGFGLACVANYLLFRRSGGKKIERVSPRMFYELARRYDEWRGEDYEGSSCRGALKGWHKHGVCSDQLWPYRTPKGRIRRLPRNSGWELNAITRPLGVYYRIDRRSIVDMQAAIQQIGAIYVSASVHDGWDFADAAEVTHTPPCCHEDIPLIPKPKDPGKTGGHAFALVGYNERGFIVQNSWSAGWGAGGFAVMSYLDWITYGTDAWAAALGVPQEMVSAQVEGVRWPARRGRSLGFFDRRVRNPHNPAEDPWPIDRIFTHTEHEPWRTAKAYAHSLVTGNDGRIVVTDLQHASNPGGTQSFIEDLMVTRPAEWFAARNSTQPTGSAKLKLVIYAHGGLNSEDAAIDRVRVLAPYFEANGIYPVFLIWRTGPSETIRAMLEDAFRRKFGIEDEDDMRAQGFFDWLGDARDRAVEDLANRTIKGLWSEMRENAARSAIGNGGLMELARALTHLRDRVGKNKLELHLIGHSAGSILLGHLLSLLAKSGSVPLKVSSLSLYAAACSVRFAVEQFLRRGADALDTKNVHLHFLSDRNEKDDYLGGIKAAGLHLYGRSLLYLVSRALDDDRKIPLLGFERAVTSSWATTSSGKNDPQRLHDQWHANHHRFIEEWQRKFKGVLYVVDAPSVPVNIETKMVQAQHGTFDNDITTITQTIQLISGTPTAIKPIESLDY